MKKISSVISLSFMVLFLLVFSLPSICFSEIKTVGFQSQKNKEIDEFSKSFTQKHKYYEGKEVEYSKIMMSQPKTNSEINDKILKIDEYNKFLIRKNKHSMSLINFYRKTNSKYKKDKSIDEQIDKLEKITREGYKITFNHNDVYKKYLMTIDDKYFVQSEKELQKLPPLREEVTRLIKNIHKSLRQN